MVDNPVNNYSLIVTSYRKQPYLVERAQRLRFEVFNQEKGEGLVSANIRGRDEDKYDRHMHHLLVVDRFENPVGTYRLWTGKRARKRGIQFYSEEEFDFHPFRGILDQTVELGRACVAANHRNGTVISHLFEGLANYMEEYDSRYLIGCSSLSFKDAGDDFGALSVYKKLRGHQTEERFRTLPHYNYFIGDQTEVDSNVKIPGLLLFYISAGAKICGPPAKDREFKTYDFLTMLDREVMPLKYRTKFFNHSARTKFDLGFGHTLARAVFNGGRTNSIS